MPTLLDNILESHTGPEPRWLTSDVQAILRRVIRPGSDEGGEAVAMIADKAKVSTRTVYRVLNPDESKKTISQDLGDSLCLACGVHPSGRVHLVWPDGRIALYGHEAE